MEMTVCSGGVAPECGPPAGIDCPANGGSAMAGKRETLKEIVSKLRQVEVLQGQGATIVEAVRLIGLTQQTCYRWRKLYDDQHDRSSRMGGGHSRSSQQLGSAKPLFRPETRLWPHAAQSEGDARGHNLKTGVPPEVLLRLIQQLDTPMSPGTRGPVRAQSGRCILTWQA